MSYHRYKFAPSRRTPSPLPQAAAIPAVGSAAAAVMCECARGAQAVIAAIASSMVGPSNQSWLSLTLPSCAMSHAEFGAGPYEHHTVLLWARSG